MQLAETSNISSVDEKVEKIINDIFSWFLPRWKCRPSKILVFLHALQVVKRSFDNSCFLVYTFHGPPDAGLANVQVFYCLIAGWLHRALYHSCYTLLYQLAGEL